MRCSRSIYHGDVFYLPIPHFNGGFRRGRYNRGSVVEIAKTILFALGLLYAVLLFVGLFLADSLMFPEPPNGYSIPGLMRLPLQTDETGAYVEALHMTHPGARHTLLYSHGNGEDLETVLPLLQEYVRRGFSVMAYEYPGYGRSPGKSNEKTVIAAIDAAYEYLTAKGHAAPADIVVYGRSMGSGPSVDLAARKSVAGLILEGGYVSAFRVITRLPLLPWDKFANERKLPQIRCPVFVLQAANDEVVGYWHGPRLFAAAKEAKSYWRVEGAGHNDLIAAAGEAYWRKLDEFIESLPAGA